MTEVDEHGRLNPPVDADETGTLISFLEFHRATLAWKCAGLDATDLRVTVAASTMTLGGLLKHLALVEDQWFSWILAGQQPSAPWDNVDWDADEDWDWHSAPGDSPEYLRTLFSDAVDRSRKLLRDALEQDGPGQLAKKPRRDGRTPSVRWILCHMIEEYARHNGHADLIREYIDGQTGE